MSVDYDLHRLGWKSFQDLCVALAEERLQRPVQTFLPTNDAGRDGAFLGTWDSEGNKESTIQCKFTSEEKNNLTLSMLADELPKAKRLAKIGLAEDYIILTNHTITGSSELQIKRAFQSVGVGRCRVFHRDWIINRISFRIVCTTCWPDESQIFPAICWPVSFPIVQTTPLQFG